MSCLSKIRRLFASFANRQIFQFVGLLAKNSFKILNFLHNVSTPTVCLFVYSFCKSSRVRARWPLIAERFHNPWRQIANDLLEYHWHATLKLFVVYVNRAMFQTVNQEWFTPFILALEMHLRLHLKDITKLYVLSQTSRLSRLLHIEIVKLLLLKLNSDKNETP